MGEASPIIPSDQLWMAETMGLGIAREHHVAAQVESLDDGLAVAFIPRRTDENPSVVHQLEGLFVVQPTGVNYSLDGKWDLADNNGVDIFLLEVVANFC